MTTKNTGGTEGSTQDAGVAPSAAEKEPAEQEAAAKEPAEQESAAEKAAQRKASAGRRNTRKRAPKTEEVERVKIKLHNNPEIPPGGLHMGLNGRGYKLVPNREILVPVAILEILDNAVRTEAVVNEDNRIVGAQDVPRFPYSVVRK